MQDRFKLNRELQLLYKNDLQFRKKMDENKSNYYENKSVLACQPDINICEQLLEIYALEKQYQIYFYYAYMQPSSKSMKANLTLYLIKNFNPKFHKKYKFVFFNNCVQDKQIYYEFKKVFLTFPFQYFLALDEFIFIRPTLSQKVSQWWTGDEIQKYFKAKTRYISTTTELCPLLRTNVSKLVDFLPRQIVLNQFPEETGKLKIRQKKLADYRMNVKGQERTFKQQKSFQVFVMSIGSFFQTSNNAPLQIDQYNTNQAKLPLVLQQLFLYFDQNPQKIRVQGLFRKSVSIDEQNQTLSQLLRNNFKYLKKIDNPHLIANLIKRFFAKLKTPIITYDCFHNLMHDQGVVDKLALVKTEVQTLPPQNYLPLMFLVEFLCQKVIPLEKFTLMNSNNLAICFAPCLLRSQKPSELDLIYATKSSHIVKIILDNFQTVFGTQSQRKKYIRSTIQTERDTWQKQLKRQIKCLSQQSSKQQKQEPFL